MSCGSEGSRENSALWQATRLLTSANKIVVCNVADCFVLFLSCLVSLTS